ncbi:MAG: cohesin domain-containing protein, partial [Bacteroidota bacterium]|nr:cohesin domain-containing protein [Bacteroidota bacterium]
LTVGSLTKREYAAGQTPHIQKNPYADNPTNPFDASGTYPIGMHKIKWFVEDGCGNVGICETLFDIKDCKAPTPYCLVGIITTVMPSSGCITIWAKDFDAGSFDNCTNRADLHFTFEGVGDSLIVCCDSFIDGMINDELVIEVKMCVEDEEGNKDCCITTLIIQDAQNVCPDVGSVTGRISGEIITAGGGLTSLTDIDLIKNGTLSKDQMTGNDGKYSFLNLEMYVNYTVKPQRNDDPLNGVTTSDIVKIQKHILGQEEISDPYKLIAGDINQSKSITAADISELRKLILGTISEFSKVNSWVFIPKEYKFPDPFNPWNYPTSQSLKLDQQNNLIDFISVKMGDINNSVRSNSFSHVSGRNKEATHFEIEEVNMKAGETYKIDFRSKDINSISAYQFTLKFDANVLEFVDTEAEKLLVNEDHFGTRLVDRGILTTSWNSQTPINVSSEDVLFSVIFRAVQNGKLGNNITINSELTQAESYDKDMNAKEVVLNISSRNGITQSGLFELYQNEPNPFTKETIIAYTLPESAPVILTIYDINGKVIRVYEVLGQKGLNKMEIAKSDIGLSGVLYYQLDAANQTATKRMLIMD